MSTENESYFITVENAKKYLKSVLQNKFEEAFFENCIKKLFFLCIKDVKQEYFFIEDLKICLNIMQINHDISESEIFKFGYNGNLWPNRIKISNGTVLFFSEKNLNKRVPAFVRNLFYYTELNSNQVDYEEEISQFDLMGTSVITCEKKIRQYMEDAVSRKQCLDRILHTNFVNSASYMGSKKKIAGFIVESMFPYIKEDSILIDIMCGSGAMSRAFAQIGRTYASDAQDFCRLLAKIQGKGYTKQRAEIILEQILPAYNRHFNELLEYYKKDILEEEYIFHMDLSNVDIVLDRYLKYIETFELYSSTYIISKEMQEKVEERKSNYKLFPYCLFTLYFANIYFGLLQCIQLDSLRYAIDQLDSTEDVDWALGVLVVTAYQISTGHAGHFAQPKKIDKKSLGMILKDRQKSAYFEFTKRFLCLAEESEYCNFEIGSIPGPWPTALERINKELEGNRVIYLDAPYKRDEYSRYYHVLETLVKYDYPHSERKGRIRSKRFGDRFSTEFFTKTIYKIEDIFVDIISEILDSGAICVWSYSDNGMASIINVINGVLKNIECDIFLYGTHYEHKSQRKIKGGNKRNIPVMEYSIIFRQKT